MADHHEPEYRGEKTNDHFKDGPLEDRGCTDILCLIIFVAFWGAMIWAGAYGLKNGNPQLLLSPWDQFGNACGLGDLQAWPYLYFVDPKSATNTACVGSCPTKDTKVIDCAPDYVKNKGACSTIQVYDTVTFFGRVCVSSDTVNAAVSTGQQQTSSINYGVVLSILADLRTAWWMILCAGGIALVIGFVYLFLMKYLTACVVWSIFFSWVGLLVGLGVYLIKIAQNPSSTAGNGSPADNITNYINLNYVAYGLFALAGISTIIILFFCSRINLAISVLEAAAEFVDDEPQVLLVPPLMFVKTIAFYAVWIVFAIYILGVNNIQANASKYPIADFTWTSMGKGLILFFIFGFFWNQAFDAALAKFLVCCTACLWYFRSSAHKHDWPLLVSLKWSIIHIGSLAFGSFLIGSLDFVRFILSVLSTQLKKQGGNNAVIAFVVACVNCCIGCIQKCIQFLNVHAYIHMAMSGDGFCKSTREAFYLILRNAARFAITHGIGNIIARFGELVIAIATAAVSYAIFTKTPTFATSLHQPIVPTIVCGLLALIVAHVMMGVYSSAADTLIHCYCMDEEMHHGQPQHAPHGLHLPPAGDEGQHQLLDKKH